MRIKELAARADVSRHTIHYYLREDLLPPPLKTGRTAAFYSGVHLECLRLIRELREEQGMPIAAVRQEVKIRFGDQWRVGKSASPLDGRNGRVGPKGQQQRQRIVETALDLFSRQGYHRTHVSHIIDALRISQGTFYKYFENKHDLLVTVFDHMIQELANTDEEISKEPNPILRSRDRGRAFFRFYEKYHKLFDIIREESIGREGKSELSIHVIYRKILDQVVGDLTEARKQGLIPNTQEDPELLSYLLFGALEFVAYRLLTDDKYSLDEVLRILTRWIGVDAPT
jgi:AcrR family transcriptional regulator